MIEARDRAKKALAHLRDGSRQALGAWESTETMRDAPRDARLFHRPLARFLHVAAVRRRLHRHGKVLPVTRQPLPPQVCVRRERLYKIRGFVAGSGRGSARSTRGRRSRRGGAKAPRAASFTRQSVRALISGVSSPMSGAQMQKMHRAAAATRRSSSALSTSGKRARPSTGCASISAGCATAG